MLKKSPFACDFLNLPEIDGIKISTDNTGLKYQGRNDLLVIRFENLCDIAGVYTKSSMPSAPVDHCRKSHESGAKAKVLFVNAGNANAFTGMAGKKSVNDIANQLSKSENCDPSQVYISSTGVIGEKLDGNYLGIKASKATNQSSWEDAANAIMTTDTFAKGAGKKVTLSDGRVISIAGIAKGSGMIAPNMGTMLAYIFTDALIEEDILHDIIKEVADKSFNSITVDGDTSTSDTFQVFATGSKGFLENKDDLNLFKQALEDVSSDLALQIVKDGEGISKLIKITVKEAENNESARKVALSIGNSPLVKTACAGEDANWGRIIMAIGKSGEKADRDKTSVAIGGITIAKNGEAVDEYDEAPINDHMKGCVINIDVSIGIGMGEANIHTTDLTHNYIDINANYRS